MLTIDEAIAHAKEVAEKNRILLNSDELVQKSYDGHFDKLKCERCAKEHEQLAAWLEELKLIKEIDLSMPQHFTKEQSDWIKSYCIRKNLEFYNKAINDLMQKCDMFSGFHRDDVSITIRDMSKIAEQLKKKG